MERSNTTCTTIRKDQPRPILTPKPQNPKTPCYSYFNLELIEDKMTEQDMNSNPARLKSELMSKKQTTFSVRMDDERPRTGAKTSTNRSQLKIPPAAESQFRSLPVGSLSPTNPPDRSNSLTANGQRSVRDRKPRYYTLECEDEEIKRIDTAREEGKKVITFHPKAQPFIERMEQLKYRAFTMGDAFERKKEYYLRNRKTMAERINEQEFENGAPLRVFKGNLFHDPKKSLLSEGIFSSPSKITARTPHLRNAY